MRKRVMSVLAAIVLLFGIVVATPSPANAVPSGCLAGHACLWTGGGYSGQVLDIAWSTWYQNGACHYLDNVYPFTFDTTTSSAYNDFGSGYRLMLWYGDCHTSGLLPVYSHTGQNLVGSAWDNHITAFTIQPL